MLKRLRNGATRQDIKKSLKERIKKQAHGRDKSMGKKEFAKFLLHQIDNLTDDDYITIYRGENESTVVEYKRKLKQEKVVKK